MVLLTIALKRKVIMDGRLIGNQVVRFNVVRGKGFSTSCPGNVRVLMANFHSRIELNDASVKSHRIY